MNYFDTIMPKWLFDAPCQDHQQTFDLADIRCKDTRHVEDARSVCYGCPFMEQCRERGDYTEGADQALALYSVLGGETWLERAIRRRIAAQPGAHCPLDPPDKWRRTNKYPPLLTANQLTEHYRIMFGLKQEPPKPIKKDNPENKHVFIIPNAYWLSSNKRGHWAQKADATRYLRQLARYTATARLNEKTARKHTGPVNVTAHIGYSINGGRIDPANAAPTVKALIDGLVDAGIVPDDDSAHMPALTFVRDYKASPKKHHTVTLVFTPAGGGDE